MDVILRQNQRYEGLLGELDRSGSGDSFGVVLKMARDVSSPHKGVQREIIFPIRDVSDVRPSGTPEGGAAKSTGRDGFQTDTDISRSTPLGQERVLTPWQADPSASSSSSKANSSAQGDADTFGAPSNGRGWDQFAENEKRFGTRTNYDEDLYTTKLDRSGKDFKERERKAEALAAQIMGTSSSNPHLQEERGQAVDASLGEEDRSVNTRVLLARPSCCLLTYHLLTQLLWRGSKHQRVRASWRATTGRFPATVADAALSPPPGDGQVIRPSAEWDHLWINDADPSGSPCAGHRGCDRRDGPKQLLRRSRPGRKGRAASVCGRGCGCRSTAGGSDCASALDRVHGG